MTNKQAAELGARIAEGVEAVNEGVKTVGAAMGALAAAIEAQQQTLAEIGALKTGVEELGRGMVAQRDLAIDQGRKMREHSAKVMQEIREVHSGHPNRT